MKSNYKTFTPLEKKHPKVNGSLTGFTLIELILVVAIIAILAAAMMPVITSTRQKARAAKFVQLLDTLITACRLFNLDTGQYANEATNSAVGNWAKRELSLAPVPLRATPGWDGPYMQRLLTNEDAAPGSYFLINDWINSDFDLDGDGAVDKPLFWPGNSMLLGGLSESEAKAIDDIIDNSVSGNWMANGKVQYTASFGGVAEIYLIDGL